MEYINFGFTCNLCAKIKKIAGSKVVGIVHHKIKVCEDCYKKLVEVKIICEMK